MENVKVTIPNNLIDNKFTFEYNGNDYHVVCPEGYGPGDEMIVELTAPILGGRPLARNIMTDKQASTAKLETEDALASIASQVIDAPTLAALSLADKTAHEATAAAMAEARYSELKPTTVEKDREPHRWGVGGPGIPGHGSVVASKKAKAALEEAGSFSVAALKIERESNSECDEGDFDVYMTSTLTFEGEKVWSLSTSCHSNIGGSWGTGHSCSIEGDKLVVSLSHAGRRVGGGHDAKEERTYELKDVLVGAAIKAGAKAPLKPDKIKLVV